MEAGALDTWQESVCMKKGRLAVKVCALCQPEQTDRVREAFFRHSSTPGIRQHGMLRHILRRESAPVHTPHGTVHVKLLSCTAVPITGKRNLKIAESWRKNRTAAGTMPADGAFSHTFP